MNATRRAEGVVRPYRVLQQPARGAFVLLVLLQLLVAGCARPKPVVGPNVNLSGYSQAFKDGFAAGCKTARGNTTKDEARMRSDADYKLGWDDGASVCAKR